MAISWDMTDDGDINIVNGNPIIINGNQEFIQALDARLRTSKGAFLDPNVGLDTTWMLNGNFRDDEVATAVEECLLQDERVISVDEIIVNRHPESASIDLDITIESTLGQINFKEVSLNADY